MQPASRSGSGTTPRTCVPTGRSTAPGRPRCPINSGTITTNAGRKPSHDRSTGPSDRRNVMPVKMGVKTGWRARSIWSELLAEFFGTFVLLAFGAGVVAGAGDWLLITWGWAMAVTMAVYVAGGVTGAHLNPAVTVAFAVKGDFPWA